MMFIYDRNLEPQVNMWEEVTKPNIIEAKIYEICREICEKGSRSRFYEEFDCIYNYIEENLENYLSEPNVDFI